MSPSVRVIVVTYSPGRHLDEFLHSLPEACSAPYSVVLVDNGSTDGAPERAQEEFGTVLIRSGGNIGYGAAANLGARLAHEPFLLVSNPDVVLGPGSIDRLLEATQRWPTGGAFGPAIQEPDGSLYPSARALPIVAHGVGHALLARIWPRNPWTRSYRLQDLEATERVAGWLSGACLLLRRSAFLQVGGFDPRYFMYFEDVDLGDRLGRAGWDSIYVPGARVTHIGSASTSRQPMRMLKAHHDSAYLYLAERHRRPWRWLFRAGLALRLRVASWHKGRIT